MADIAVLGATSHIAKDYILRAQRAGHRLYLFSRRPREIADWLACRTGKHETLFSHGYEEFGAQNYEAILNCVGAGPPARAVSMGAEILDVTRIFDKLAVDYLKERSQTRYIFLSSGAAFGSQFERPVDADTLAAVPLNVISPHNYYSVAKLYAEVCHRALPELPIIDIRIFGYFSRTVDVASRFFLADILQALREKRELEVGASSMYRDYVVADDFFALMEAVLRAPPTNDSLDSYSLAPVEKFELLDAMKNELGLRYRIGSTDSFVSATGLKQVYYSLNRKAARYGYKPSLTALDGVLAESRAFLNSI